MEYAASQHALGVKVLQLRDAAGLQGAVGYRPMC